MPSASSTGGLRGHIVVTGGCLSWGANYVAATYAHPSTTTYGVWAVNASGGVFAERGTNSRTLPFHDSLNSINQCPTFPVMGIARTRGSGGYWIATAGGGVFATRTKMGSTFRGSRGTGQFTGPMTAIVSDPTATGYWLVDVMGQVYAYGTGVGAYGNAPGTLAAKHAFDGDSVVAMAATPTGGGYWMLTNYGTVFAIGAPAQAAMSSFTDPGPGTDPADLYVGITPGPGGQGFWLVRKDGTTYAFGEPYYGNHSPSSTRDYMVAIAGTQDDGGYLLMNLSGQYYAAGDAPSVTNDPYVAPPPPPPPPAPAGSPPEQTLGSGNPATNNSPPCGGDPVNCEDGDLWETDTDVTVPGKGPHLDLARTYNSLDASTLGIFGYGWSDTYTMSLAVLPTVSAMVTEANGSTVTFYTSETGIFVAPQGTLATLVRRSTGGYSFCLRNTSTYTFNADGRLVAEQDLNGYTTTLTYQSVSHHQGSGSYQTGQLASVTDPSGRSVTFAYNATGLVSSVTNPAGGVTSYAYTHENLVSVTDPAGRVTRYSYDSKHRMVTETSRTGGVTTTTYGPGGQRSPDRGYTTGKVVRQQDPTGLVTKWTYTGNNAKSGTTVITGPHGSVTKETFTDGQMATKTTGSGTPSAATWHYTYTATTFGQTSVTDPAGHTKTTAYNATGDVTFDNRQRRPHHDDVQRLRRAVGGDRPHGHQDHLYLRRPWERDEENGDRCRRLADSNDDLFVLAHHRARRGQHGPGSGRTRHQLHIRRARRCDAHDHDHDRWAVRCDSGRLQRHGREGVPSVPGGLSPGLQVSGGRHTGTPRDVVDLRRRRRGDLRDGPHNTDHHHRLRRAG